MANVTLKGLEALQKDFAKIPNKTMSGIEKAMGHIYDKSQPLVPVDTGELKKSGKITKLDNGYQIKYQAFNGTYDYAPIQHENRKFKHTVGQAKYLEDAINLDELEQIIVGEILK